MRIYYAMTPFLDSKEEVVVQGSFVIAGVKYNHMRRFSADLPVRTIIDVFEKCLEEAQKRQFLKTIGKTSKAKKGGAITR